MTKQLSIITMLFWLGIFLLIPTLKSQAQTEGTLTFTFTENHAGSSKNVMAVWIEDNTNAFVKTHMRYWGNGTNDHLPSWKANSNQNTVDALTGPTRTSSTNPPAFGVKTVVWDGTDANGTVVNDGTYHIFVESSWNHPEPSYNHHSTIIDFTFEKGVNETHLTPDGDSYFSDITLDWVPASGVFIEKINDASQISVYPNPSNGFISLKLDENTFVSRLLIEDTRGEVVYQKSVNSILESNSIDLSQLANGIYFLDIILKDQSQNIKTKIVINK